MAEAIGAINATESVHSMEEPTSEGGDEAFASDANAIKTSSLTQGGGSQDDTQGLAADAAAYEADSTDRNANENGDKAFVADADAMEALGSERAGVRQDAMSGLGNAEPFELVASSRGHGANEDREEGLAAVATGIKTSGFADQHSTAGGLANTTDGGGGADEQESMCCLCGDQSVAWSKGGNCDWCKDHTSPAGETFLDTWDVDGPSCNHFDKSFNRANKNQNKECLKRCKASPRAHPASKCCLCGDLEVAWSRVGNCDWCKDHTNDAGNTFLDRWDVKGPSCNYFDKSFDHASKNQNKACLTSCKASPRAQQRSRCCLCGDQSIAWSKGGRCDWCKGHANDAGETFLEQWEVQPSCNYFDKSFNRATKGQNKACLTSCRDARAKSQKTG